MKKFILIVSILFFLLIIAITLRNTLLTYYIKTKTEAFNTQYSTKIIIAKTSFTSLNTISINKILLINSPNDTLITIKNLTLHVRLFPLLIGKLFLKKLLINDCNVSINKTNTINTLSFIKPKKQNPKNSIEHTRNFEQTIKNIINTLYSRIPKQLQIKNLIIKVTYNDSLTKIAISKLNIKNDSIKTIITVTENNMQYKIINKGYINRKMQQTNLLFYKTDTSKFLLPFVQNQYNAQILLDTLALTLTSKKNNNGLGFNFFSKTSQLQIYHTKISTSPILFNHLLSASLNIVITNNGIELQPTSLLQYGELNFNLSASYYPKNQLTVSLTMNRVASQTFFDMLPPKIFTNISGIKTNGMLSYNLFFQYPISNPDSLKFESNLTGKNFSIVAFGKTNLDKLNHPFNYIIYNNTFEVRSIAIDTLNPNYVKMEKVPKHLIDAILICEDPSFFSHRGFIMDAIRESIIQNIKERRFARGGSTITMQLVKNVFLNKEKNIARKLEEILITWLIENCQITKKKQLFEIYLNLIEWGPNVYGISEASYFYFKKKPWQLTLEESVFLATIIPTPKWYKSYFNESGNLKEYKTSQMIFIAERMLLKKCITLDEFNAFNPANLILKTN